MTRLTNALVATLALIATATLADAAPKKRAGSVSPAADETALVGLHDLRREGGKVCMSSHSHNGSSAGQPSKKAAEVAAMQAWSSFTALEYGGSWGNPGLAGDRQMRCSGGGNSHNCDFEARPCRR